MNPIIEPALSEAAQPDFMLEINPERTPGVELPEIQETLVDASKLVQALSRYGGKVFTWSYPLTAEGEREPYYTVSTDLAYPISVEREENLAGYALELGAVEMRLEPAERDTPTGGRERIMRLRMRFDLPR